jgi:iron complex outermembrane receptor protein
MLTGIAALVLAAAVAPDALGQAALPEIVVTAPSPIRRVPGPVAPPSAPAPAPVETSLPGTLPIVTDQFATVTVVPNEELRRNGGATLGDVLFDKPGITGSSFAPGASSRPIIRGLDVNRVGILENGLGGGGASDLGEDHFVPIDPLATSQIEVIRGPATLRWGSQSIGGVVSATNNRIPDTLPCREGAPLPSAPFPVKARARGADAAPCATIETRGAVTTVDNGLEGGVLVDAGVKNFAFHADAYGRKADDYRIPSYPYLFDPGRPFNGTQRNSSLHTDGGSVGGSFLFDGGFFGIAVIQNNALYHIPGIDGEDHNTRIDARQTKLLSKGEYRPQSSAVDTVRWWFGITDYKHDEIGLADPADLGSDGVRQTFTNKEQEGRVEVTLAPFDLRFAQLTAALGVQAGHQDLTASSPDDPTSPLNGLYAPNSNKRVAGYIFNEFKFSDTTKAQIAGRIERVNLNGSVPAFIPDAFDINADPTSIGTAEQRSLQFTPKSASVGLIQDLLWGLIGSVTAQYVERAPKSAELFSRGPHDATGTFDIGNPDLKTEVAKSVEIGLRRATAPLRFELTAYYTRFDGFIFRNLTGSTCDEASCVAANDPNPLELKQARYSQRDAIFRGGEFQSQLDIAPLGSGMFGIENQFDIVRATFTDGTNVPRIPPLRVGGGLFWRDANWLARVNLLHAFAHNDIQITPTFAETPTAGYNDLRAEVSYRKLFAPNSFGRLRDITVGIRGQNLLNDDIRNSVSFTKDEVLMPGRSVRAFANVRF